MLWQDDVVRYRSPFSVHERLMTLDRDGDEAALYAAGRPDLLLEEGDIEGAAVWRAILTAIEELDRERGPGDGTN